MTINSTIFSNSAKGIYLFNVKKVRRGMSVNVSKR